MHRTAALALGTLGLAAVTAFPALANAKDPKAFLDQAIRGDVAKVQLGQLAEANGASIGVKNFGQTLDSDHSIAAAEATQVASAHGITPPGDLTPAAQQELDKLAKLSGPAFDREFTRAMIAEQRSDIRAFEAEAKANQGDVSALAAKQLPTLRAHLQTAENLQRESRMHSAK